MRAKLLFAYRWCIKNMRGTALKEEKKSMKHKITLIPGDGIGPEVTKPTLAIIKAAGVKIDWETHWREPKR
jgi:Isocitrate/isopropylmalate dehydrogenase